MTMQYIYLFILHFFGMCEPQHSTYFPSCLKNTFYNFSSNKIYILYTLSWISLNLSVCVRRLRGGGMVSPQLVTTLGRRWRPGREGRGSAWAGRVHGHWFSERTPRVSVSRSATSLFTLQSPPCTPTSRWDLQVLENLSHKRLESHFKLKKAVELC